MSWLGRYPPDMASVVHEAHVGGVVMSVAVGIRVTVVIISPGIECVARGPDPAVRGEGNPPPIVVRPPAPGFVADPVPAIRVHPGPAAVIIRSPSVRDVGPPDVSVIRCPHPLSILPKLGGR